jgi:hypothetical protein
VILDRVFAAEVEQMLLADLDRSVEMQPGDYENKPYWFRLMVRFSRLTAPIQ